MFGWVVLAVYVVWRLKFSSFGRAMFAQREDRWAAQSVGIAMMPPRLLAFVVSAFFTAVAGSLYAHFITSMSPNVFYFDLTFRVITMLVLGGLGSVSGSILGTVLIVGLAEALRRIEDVTLLYGMSNIVIAAILAALDHLPAPGSARPTRAQPGVAVRQVNGSEFQSRKENEQP